MDFSYYFYYNLKNFICLLFAYQKSDVTLVTITATLWYD